MATTVHYILVDVSVVTLEDLFSLVLETGEIIELSEALDDAFPAAV